MAIATVAGFSGRWKLWSWYRQSTVVASRGASWLPLQRFLVLWTSICSLASQVPLRPCCGFSPPPRPHTNTHTHSTAIPIGTLSVCSSLSHFLPGGEPRKFSYFLQTSRTQGDWSLRDEKAGGGEEMDYISDLTGAHTGDDAICTLWYLPVSIGDFERLCLLRVPGMKWSISPCCPLWFGGGDSKQSPTVASKLSCSPLPVLFCSAPSPKTIIISIWRENIHVLSNTTVDDIKLWALGLSGPVSWYLKGSFCRRKKKKKSPLPQPEFTTHFLLLFPTHCPSLLLSHAHTCILQQTW